MVCRTRAIYGCSGTELSPEERAFFREAQPWGFILFARNVSQPNQVKALVSSLRDTVGDDQAPVLIDQEGGRVARLRPPHWRTHPPAQRFGDLYRSDPEAARQMCALNARLIASELFDLGINADCVPVLDVPVKDADAIIGNRAFSNDPEIVTALGRTMVDGLLDGGVLPVIKHLPGHGRANADSHLALPRVGALESELRVSDFAPFRALNDCPLAMTAHVVYTAIDPDRPATTSETVISDVIRGWIGFDGLLMSDDLSMKALSNSFGERTRAALDAGCDIVLHCNGALSEMLDVAAEATLLEGQALARAERALARLRPPKPFNAEIANGRLNECFGAAA
ncbi:MAG: beta-N-acetylhexosaminidase [Alphaproteobacteria bacterium]|nr:beta-N-acetylhexosaminidase [Alphaproteobacteria bacterium]